MENLASNTACEHCDAEEWRDTVGFFGIESEEKGYRASATKRISIVGLTTRPYIFQAHGMRWMLSQEEGLANGGFLCDDPGYGKVGFLRTCRCLMLTESQTIQMIGKIQLGWNIVRARIDILQQPDRHFSSTKKHSTQPSSSSCLVKRSYGVACPCLPSVTTHDMSQYPGPTLVVVGKSLIVNWLKNWKRHVDRGTSGLKIFVGHNATKYEGFSTFTAADAKLLATNEYGEHEWGQNRFVVITTRNSYQTCVANLFDIHPKVRKPRSLPDLPESTDREVVAEYRKVVRAMKQSAQIPIKWSCLMRDEFHEEWRPGYGTPALFDSLRSYGWRPYIWAASGTPFESGPKEFEGYLLPIEKGGVWGPSTDDDGDMKILRFESIESLQSRIDSADKKGDLPALLSLSSEFGRMLQKIVLRRSENSTWHGRPIFARKPHKHTLFRCPTTSDWAAKLKVLADGLRRDAQNAYDIRMERWRRVERLHPGRDPKPVMTQKNFVVGNRVQRIAASFPYVIDMVSGQDDDTPEDQRITLTKRDFQKGKDFHLNSECIFRQKVDDIARSSGKIQRLREWIGTWDKDDVGRTEKAVLLSEFPTSAYLAYLCLEKYYGRAAVVFVHAGHSTDEREEHRLMFEDSKGVDGSPLYPNHNPRFLVSTTEIMGKGVDLVRARYMVLIEPFWRAGVELQADFRVHRVGQPSNATETIKCMAEGNEIEPLILDKSKLRAMLRSEAFSGVVGGSPSLPIIM
ncbi:MAG: hypothetical protein Q9187_000791 [Circinaria calcarea]